VFLLDSNVCIRLLNQKDQCVEKYFRQCNPLEISLCSVVKAELLYGARHSQYVEDNLQRLALFFSPLGSLPFDDHAAEIYARIRQDLSMRGCLIGPNDLLIAAIALSKDAILVSHNTKEFSRVSGLRLVDWEV